MTTQPTTNGLSEEDKKTAFAGAIATLANAVREFCEYETEAFLEDQIQDRAAMRDHMLRCANDRVILEAVRYLRSA